MFTQPLRAVDSVPSMTICWCHAPWGTSSGPLLGREAHWSTCLIGYYHRRNNLRSKQVSQGFQLRGIHSRVFGASGGPLPDEVRDQRREGARRGGSSRSARRTCRVLLLAIEQLQTQSEEDAQVLTFGKSS
jgi:hypothetical protein